MLRRFHPVVQPEYRLLHVDVVATCSQQSFVVLPRVQVADVPTQPHTGYIIRLESALQHIQSGVTVSPLCEYSQLGHITGCQTFLLHRQLPPLRFVKR